MKYVRYGYKESDGAISDRFDDVLMKEDDGHLYICELLCVEWLLAAGKPEWVSLMPAVKYSKADCVWTEIPRPDASRFRWIFDFPLKDGDFADFPRFLSFFRTFSLMGEAPFLPRLERAVDMLGSAMPREALARSVSHAVAKHPGDRMRASLCRKIRLLTIEGAEK